MALKDDIFANLKSDAEWALEYLFKGIAALFIRNQPNMPPNEQKQPSQPSVPPTPTPAPRYDWSTPEAARHSLRVICDEEGLTVAQKNLMSQVVHCESGYNIHARHYNLVGGKVVSTDFSICQINDHYHIGPGKDFPSVEYVINNPEAQVRWMCTMVKEGKINLWVCASSGLFEKYSA